MTGKTVRELLSRIRIDTLHIFGKKGIRGINVTLEGLFREIVLEIEALAPRPPFCEK